MQAEKTQSKIADLTNLLAVANEDKVNLMADIIKQDLKMKSVQMHADEVKSELEDYRV